METRLPRYRQRLFCQAVNKVAAAVLAQVQARSNFAECSPVLAVAVVAVVGMLLVFVGGRIADGAVEDIDRVVLGYPADEDAPAEDSAAAVLS